MPTYEDTTEETTTAPEVVIVTPQAVPPESGKTLFHFPTIGQGISILATCLEEAESLVAKLK